MYCQKTQADRSCRVPILLSYSLTDEGQLRHHQTLTLGGNAIDVGVGPSLWEIVVSIDTVHKPGSMKILHPEEETKTDYFETLELFSNLPEDADVQDTQIDGSPEADLRWESSSLAMLLNGAAAICQKGNLPSEAPLEDKNRGAFSPAGEILYGLENLRKKRGQAAVEAEQQIGEDEVALPEQAS